MGWSAIEEEEVRGNTKILCKSSVPAEIRTEHLQNANLEPYRYTNPLDEASLNKAKV
jgi:hypothetical protein